MRVPPLLVWLVLAAAIVGAQTIEEEALPVPEEPAAPGELPVLLPGDPDALREQAEDHYARGELVEAARLYHQAAALGADPRVRASDLVLAAELEHRLKRPDEARQTMRDALLLDPGVPFQREIYLQEPEFVRLYDESLAWALEERERVAIARTREGAERLQAGDREGARELYLEALALQPGYTTALYNLALLDLAEDRRQEALAGLERVLALDRSEGGWALTPKLRAQVATLAGKIHRERGFPEEAERHLEEAVGLDPESADAWLNLGLTRLDRDQTDTAIHALSAAYRLAPGDLVVLEHLSRALTDAGRLEDVVEVLDAATGLHPGEVRLWLTLGTTRHRLGDLAGAARALERVVSLDPDNGQRLAQVAAPLLTDLRYRLGEFAAAATAARQALDWTPDDAALWTWLGLAQIELGEPAAAVESHRRASQLAPRRAEYQTHLGAAYLRLDDLRAAAEAFRRAVEIDPAEEAAAASLARLNEVLDAAVAELGLRLAKAAPGATPAAGALVAEVERRTVAAGANLRPGDLIIRVGERLIATPDDFRHFAYKLPTGILQVVVMRGGKPKTLKLKLE